MMYGCRESDSSIVSEKLSNKDDGSAEKVEKRELTKENLRMQNRFRTQGRANLENALKRIRQAVRRYGKEQLTALWHHVYDMDTLRDSFYGLNRNAIAGVDGATWRTYEEQLERNIGKLSERLRRGAYRPPPVNRIYIPKPDGKERPIGIPTLEDKLVQRATTTVLNAIYELEFKGFSYGFRPGRSPHHALDALYVAVHRKKINWVYDADIQGFFDAIDHEWLIKFIEHRIGDRRVIRHIRKWLMAGVMEDGRWRQEETGTPQGGSISPLLANIYLHYALDLWVHRWREKSTGGDVIIVRFADDCAPGNVCTR